MTGQTYKAPVSCSNCQWSGKIIAKFGTDIRKYQCPNCGNKNLDSTPEWAIKKWYE